MKTLLQNRSVRPLLLAVVGAFFLSGCAAYGGVFSERYPRSEQYRKHRARQYGIPPGHMPPPGECRIWYRGVPPGQQPPPGPCHRLRYRVPPGAFLVRG